MLIIEDVRQLFFRTRVERCVMAAFCLAVTNTSPERVNILKVNSTSITLLQISAGKHDRLHDRKEHLIVDEVDEEIN